MRPFRPSHAGRSHAPADGYHPPPPLPPSPPARCQGRHHSRGRGGNSDRIATACGKGCDCLENARAQSAALGGQCPGGFPPAPHASDS
eukprot:8246476-Pyramimonas_sp.AAC.1